MPPKSLINLAPPISTERKKVATKHAIVPWFGEGMRGGSLGLWWSLNGKLVVILSLEHLSCILREEIPVIGLFPALFFHVSEESSRSLAHLQMSMATSRTTTDPSWFLTIQSQKLMNLCLLNVIGANFIQMLKSCCHQICRNL